jgi:hypothetical protein
MFYGPPGNGKTISIKALMHGLLDRKDRIPTLYVKTAPYEYHIKNVFDQARRLSPCMLVLEDIETIVTPQTRSYFFNQMDGLEDNSGLFVVASTNYLDRLDPGLTSRPSRFDRKYLFPIPNEHERTLYCEYWRRKVAHKGEVKFPQKLCPAMARITHGFSFAFLQECFVASLLSLIHQEAIGGDDDDLEKYELWVAFKKQADVLRKEIRKEGVQSEGNDNVGIASSMQMMGLQASTPASSTGAPYDRRPASRARQPWSMDKTYQQSPSSEYGSQSRPVERTFEELAMADDVTAVLPLQKRGYISSAAFDWRI